MAKGTVCKTHTNPQPPPTTRFRRLFTAWDSTWRWIIARPSTIRAAVATIFEAINEDDDGKLLPGVGAGLRFTVDTETHMNVGMDIAVGLEDWGIYFRFGEAF